MRSGFSAAFAASDGRDPVPRRAQTKAGSSATAGADSTPDAPIPCLGTLGPIDDSVVNVTEHQRRRKDGKDGNHGMKTARKQSAKTHRRGFRELPTNTKRGAERNEIEYMRGNAGFVFNHTDVSLRIDACIARTIHSPVS